MFAKKTTGIERCKINKIKSIPDLDKYLIFSFSVLIFYSICEFIVSTVSGYSHDTLTMAVYGVFGGELLLCAMIKRFKLKRGDS